MNPGKWQILITPNIPESGIKMLEEFFDVEINKKGEPLSKKELMEKIKRKHALCCGAEDIIDAEVMDAAPNLKIIARFGAGYDNIDVKEATKRKIYVTCTPGAPTESVADMTWCLILALGRRLLEADRFVRKGLFTKTSPPSLKTRDVSGKTLGIIGAGKIGTAVGKRAIGFNMKIIYADVAENRELEKIGAKKVSLEYLLVNSDFVSLHVPLNDSTYHLIGEKEFSLMKNTAYLINTSRGKVVDEKALVRALKTGKIKGAALDVYEREPEVGKELVEMENVILTPHTASNTEETWGKMAEMVAEDCILAFKGEKPKHLVNPEVLE